MSPAAESPKPARSAVLFWLALCNFAVGMGAFVVVGVLSPLAESFAISKAQAGWVMTAYALVYAVASPVLVSLTGMVDRRRVLMTGLGLFLLGSMLASVAPTYPVLLLARALMAVGGGLVTPVAAAVGVALVSPEARGRALSTVFGGLTLSQALGVPLGAWVGYQFGWHAAFHCASALSLACLVAVARAVPAGIRVPPVSLSTLGEVLTTPRLVVAVSLTAFFLGGMYVLYTFMGPFLEATQGMGRDGVTAMFTLFGVGAVLGNAMGGFLTDRIGPRRTLIVLGVAQLLIMPALTGLGLGLPAAALMVLLWSVFGWSFMVPQQARLASLDPARTAVLFALNASAVYAGSSVGSTFGAALLAATGYVWLGLGGALLVLLGLATLWMVKAPVKQAA
jgi:DHA1 family inner membrane transport protein